MTRKLLMTVAIVAIALAPSIGIGTAQARGFGGGLHGGGFGGRGFYGGYGRSFYRGYGRGFTAGMVASIRVSMDMVIPHIVTTAIDRVQLAAQNGAGLERSQSPAYRRGLGYLLPRFRPRLAWSGYLGAAISPDSEAPLALEDHRFARVAGGLPGIGPSSLSGVGIGIGIG